MGSLPFKPKIPIDKIYPNANPLALELLQARADKSVARDEAPLSRPAMPLPCRASPAATLPRPSHGAALPRQPCRHPTALQPSRSSRRAPVPHPPLSVPPRRSQRMLRFHPSKRISVEEALQDPYLASLHDPSDEPMAHAEFSFEFEKMQLTKVHLRQLVAKEMLAFHPDCNWDADAASPLAADSPALPPEVAVGGSSQPVEPTTASPVLRAHTSGEAMAIEPTEVDQRVPSAAAEPAALAGEATLEDELAGGAQPMQEG